VSDTIKVVSLQIFSVRRIKHSIVTLFIQARGQITVVQVQLQCDVTAYKGAER